MAQRNSYHVFILLVVFQSSLPQRRIKDGKEVESDKKYMAYLLKASSDEHDYRGWLCGGAILSKDYVLTSAACVQDVHHLYVVPGYKKYVAAEKIDDDECVTQKKKKVILTCVPKNYHFDYNRTEVWSKVDIAVIKVESSFDFTDKSFETVCSYTPQAIDYNTEKEFPKPNDDVIVMGWGHNKLFRKDKEEIDMNQLTLRYAPTRVLDEETCVAYYKGNKELVSLIASSMLCTLLPGNLNDKGELILRSPPSAQGCITAAARTRGVVGKMCDEEEREDDMIYEGFPDGPVVYEDEDGEVFFINETRRKRRHYNHTRRQNNEEKKPSGDGAEYKLELLREEQEAPTEPPLDDGNGKGATKAVALPSGDEQDDMHTPGICQNDHGGPLVAWRGGQEMIVGVATLYRLDKHYRCMGPYLFTKTWCNGAFLKCIVDQEPPVDGRRSECDEPEEIGFEIVRRHISWVGHRDGPADNERIQVRQQVPMSAYQPEIPKLPPGH